MNKLLLGMLASAGMLIAASAQAAIIDNFDSGNGGVAAINNPGDPLLCNVAGCTQTLATSPGDALNDERTITLLSGNLGSAISVSGGVLSVGALNAPTTATVSWNAGPNAADFIDLTADGSTGIIAKILAIDVGLVDLRFDVTGTAGNGSSFLELSGLNVGNAEFDYASFSGDFSSLENAHSIMLTITGTGVSTDLQLDLLSTTEEVPEPATLGLLGAGLIGLGLAGRRRRRS